MMKYCEKDTKTTQNVFVMVQRLMNLITIFFYKVHALRFPSEHNIGARLSMFFFPKSVSNKNQDKCPKQFHGTAHIYNVCKKGEVYFCYILVVVVKEWG